MNPSGGNKVIFVINEKAGGNSKEGLKEKIETRCRAEKIEPVFVGKEKGFGPKELKERIKNERPIACVAGGGDGTVSLVGSALLGTDMPLGILPLGSSNALSKNLGIGQTMEESLDTIFGGKARAIDTLCINGDPCFHICDVGLNARLIKRFHGSKVRGMITYGWLLIKELAHYRTFPFALQAGGKELRGRAFSISFTNTKMYGTGAHINPEGDPDDGHFEIAIVRPYPAYAFLGLFVRLFTRTLHKSRYTSFLRVKEARLRNLNNMEVHIDGEPIETHESLHVKILPKSLRVLVP